MKGFTLIETTLVIGLLGILALFTVLIGYRLFIINTVETTAQNLTSTLRTAASRARLGENNSSFGVSATSGVITLYQGSSYATRVIAQDEILQVSTAVTFSGTSSVTFTKSTGIPSWFGDILIQSKGIQRTVRIYQGGLIESL